MVLLYLRRTSNWEPSTCEAVTSNDDHVMRYSTPIDENRTYCDSEKETLKS